jgi:hypothetical protein
MFGCRLRLRHIVLGNFAPIRLDEPAVQSRGLLQHSSILLNTRALHGTMSEGLFEHSSSFGFLLHDSGFTLVQISEDSLV